MESMATMSYVNASIILFGYILQNTALSYFFYANRKGDPTAWKIQPTKHTDRLGTLWGLPIVSSKPGRAPWQVALMTFNLLLATCFSFVVTEACIRGHSKMVFSPALEYGFGRILRDLLVAWCYENVAEYYWHRLLHWGPLYRMMHKVHHVYKSPEPFDDMMIHPFESFAYYMILYAPPFLFQCHVYSFLGYMAIMGAAGTLDHSGIRLNLDGVYDTECHDKHHERFNVNFGFPHCFLDILHGTYEGTFLGRTYRPSLSKGKEQ